jgi:hypothetical protein
VFVGPGAASDCGPWPYAYFEEEAGGRRSAAKLLERDEARRIAANVSKLPELLTTNAVHVG